MKLVFYVCAFAVILACFLAFVDIGAPWYAYIIPASWTVALVTAIYQLRGLGK